MNYRKYKGPRLSYALMSAELRPTALASFVAINMTYLRKQRASSGSLHQRINGNFWQKLARSRTLVLRIEKDPAYAVQSFEANLTEFTEDGEYLNLFLEK